MSSAKVLLLENDRLDESAYKLALEKRGYTVAVETRAAEALLMSAQFNPAIVVLDAVSFKTSGARLCRQLRAALNNVPILLVLDKKTEPDLNCGATAILHLPFTPRKLLNMVARLLPGDESNYIKVGPVKLNMAQRRVVCGGHEERVTPKQAKLLEMFLLAPGEIISRKDIIKHVWETDYVGDTRTLDVHISWLRNVLEADPRQPKYLKTLRGQGYILDLSAWPK